MSHVQDLRDSRPAKRMERARATRTLAHDLLPPFIIGDVVASSYTITSERLRDIGTLQRANIDTSARALPIFKHASKHYSDPTTLAGLSDGLSGYREISKRVAKRRFELQKSILALHFKVRHGAVQDSGERGGGSQ